MVLKTMVDLQKRDFILQYVGEVISARTYLERFGSKKVSDPVYLMQFYRDQLIGAE